MRRYKFRTRMLTLSFHVETLFSGVEIGPKVHGIQCKSKLIAGSKKHVMHYQQLTGDIDAVTFGMLRLTDFDSNLICFKLANPQI